jgi:hypothetical protein
MTPGKYPLSVTRDGMLVLRRSLDRLDAANEAIAEALAGYPDCEIKLSEGSTVILSAGPATPLARPRPG